MLKGKNRQNRNRPAAVARMRGAAPVDGGWTAQQAGGRAA
jgi:hypothetical protein